jgi:hypothetical protein
MALKLFRRMSKAAKEHKVEEKIEKLIVEVRSCNPGEISDVSLSRLYIAEKRCSLMHGNDNELVDFTSADILVFYIFVLLQDKIPEDVLKVERVAMALVDKQETIDEEGDVSTVESGADEPANETENTEPTAETKEISEEQTKEQSSPFACCQGSPADVMKNLQAAVGMA